MKLANIKSIHGIIELQSGLHIGSGDNAMHIGGTDNPVIKHPHNNNPYIPGSSLKGKIRSLLEWHLGLVAYTNGRPFGFKALTNLKETQPDLSDAAKRLVQLFGISGGEASKEDMADIGPTRLTFRDCQFNPTWLQELKEKNWPKTEVKFENSINRIAGTAENPRNTERVPAGAQFDFTLNLKCLDIDDEPAQIQLLLTGLKLLEMDALGGAGSRGYGKLVFKLDDESLQQQLDSLDPFNQSAA